jgi:Asp-tRNA(Asn)/Glu-tRNA(Gln) amidotransferase A subunit family amidase
MIPRSLRKLAAHLGSGDLILETYLEALEQRIAEREPQVLALVPEDGRFERLQRQARELLERYPEPGSRPPLFGVPLGVKDIFRVDGFPTGAGSRLPSGEFEGEESEAVTRLKEAGALILGKTVSTEFAYFAPGVTRNPHDPRRTPGGSSSGSAAAVGAGECPLTLGTQTIGSISRPASYCGVVGYKPSYDRIPRRGVIPLSPSLDHIGPFAETVGGVRLAASILCEEWRDESPTSRPTLGVPAGAYLDNAEADGRELFGGVCDRLRSAGYAIVLTEAMPEFAAIVARHQALVAADAAEVHAHWYAEYGDRYHPKTAELLERGREVSESDLERARAGRQELRRELMLQMAEHGIDLWISPASCGVAPIGLDSTGSPVMNLPWTHAGLPTVSVPAARDADGLPFGLQVAAGFWRDERLLGWAEEIEAVVDPDAG